jgi:predicted negative regulator of RcsB-dependent stress response
VAHISRRELKKDEFRDSLETGYEFLTTHKNTIWQVAVVVLVVAGAVFAWRYYTGQQSAKASTAYAEAVRIYDAPVQGSTQTPMPGEKTYASDTVKYEAAQKALGKVAMEYGGTRYGQMARYYAAVSLEHLDRYSDAVKWLEPMTHRGDAQFQALAKFELAHVYEKMGKSQQALALYQQLLKKPSVFVPKPVVLLALGDHYQAAKNTSEAVKYYEQIKSEYPNTGLADQANQRLEMLGKT